LHHRVVNIIRNLICVFLLTIIGQTNTSGQEFAFPESWENSWYKVPSLFKRDTLKICFLGDIMMHGKQIENTHRGSSDYDFSSFFSLIEEDIKNADLAVGNMEYTLGGKPYTGYPSFSAPDGFETYLAECGFDVFLTANNHIFDKGAAGAERTLKKLRELQKTHNIRFTGLAGSEEELAQITPLFIRIKGHSLALINFTYGTNQACGKHWPKTNYLNNTQDLEQAFEKAQGADFIIALPHWGTEYILKHSKEQEKHAAWMVESGADVIIGTHPHVIQDYQEIEGVPVAYSLGNAVSNMSATNTQLELMVTLKIVRHYNGDVTMLPLEFKPLWCSLPGGYNNSYTVIPVEEFLDKRDSWHGKWDYDKMVNTYNRIKNIIPHND
jgi:poly-gamma-glutamate synthesis protein (capsule biosynthesis protein)